MFAVTRDREVGVHVERIRGDQDHEQIAAQFLSGRETAAIRALPQAERAEAFFRCWTRKEALVKATGKGLSVPLGQFDVSVAPGEPAALVSTRFDAAEASRWSLAGLTVGEGYAATLAVEGHGWRLRRWQWPLEWAGGAGRSDR